MIVHKFSGVFFGRFYSFIQNIVKLQMIYLYQEEKEKNEIIFE